MPPRQRLGTWQSFGAFDDDDDELAGAPTSRGKGKKGKQTQPASARKFSMKSDPHGKASPGEDPHASLLAMFGDVFDHDIIQSVLAAHNNNMDATVQILLEMANTETTSQEALSTLPSSSKGRNPYTPHTRISTPAGPSPPPTSTSQSTPPQLASPSASPGPSYWDVLPVDIRHLVLSHLPYAALAKAAATNTDFSTRIRSLREKVRRVEVPAKSTMYSIEGMVASHTRATSVNLSRLARSMKHCENIRQALVGVFRGGRSARRKVPLQGLCLNRIQVVTENEIQTICTELEHLRELDLSECVGVGDAALRCLARYRTGTPPDPAASDSPPPPPPGLTSLTLARCDTITADGVKDLLSGPATRHSLIHLDVSRCMRLNKSAFHLPSNSRLQVLRAGGCNALTSLSIQLPTSSPLHELHLPFSPQLRRVLVVADNLHLLNLSGCSKLVELNFSCKQLRELNLAQATSLPTIQAPSSCPHLRTLKLNSCRVLETLSLQQLVEASPALTHLDIEGCWLVSSLQLLLQRDLEVLSMRACSNLRSVSVVSQVLQRLDATSCGVLTSLALEACPQQLLALTKCSNLATLVVGTSRGTPAAEGAARSCRVDVKGCDRLDGKVLEMLERLQL